MDSKVEKPLLFTKQLGGGGIDTPLPLPPPLALWNLIPRPYDDPRLMLQLQAARLDLSK